MAEEMAPYDSNPMDEQEARQYVAWVKSALEDARTYLLELHNRRGWVPLGYPTFKAMCEAEFGYSEAQAYKRVHAAEVQVIIGRQLNSPAGEFSSPIISTKAGEALYQIKRDEGEAAMVETYTDLAASGPVTEQRVRASRPPKPKPLTKREEAHIEYRERVRELAEDRATDPFYIQEQALAGWRKLMQQFVQVDAALMAESLDEQAYTFVQSSVGILRAYMVDLEAARGMREEA